MDNYQSERQEELEEQIIELSNQVTKLGTRPPYLKYCSLAIAFLIAMFAFSTTWKVENGQFSIDYRANNVSQLLMSGLSLVGAIYGVKKEA